MGIIGADMKNYRIVERSYEDGDKCYIVQKRGFIFRWMWFQIEDELVGMITFKSFDKALEYTKRVSTPKYVDKVVYSRKEKLEKLLEK